MGSAAGAPYPLDGMRTEWVQPDGTHLSLRVIGDEFYARTTTEDGYTVVFDAADKTYNYATIGKDGGSLVSSGITASQGPPLAFKKHLEDSKDNVSALRRANVQKFAPDREKNWAARVTAVKLRRARAAAAGLPAGAEAAPAAALAAPVAGAMVGLVILAQFPDDPATGDSDPVNFPVTQSKMTRYCNQAGYTDDGNTGSIRDYFYDQSNGQLAFTQLVTAVVTLPHPRNYYNYSDYPANSVLLGSGTTGSRLVIDAVARLRSDGFNFSTLSVNASNQVLATSLLFAGNDSGVWAQGLWPHTSWLANINVGTSASPRYIAGYQCTNVPDTQPVIGIMCHELSHLLLGYSDLYDYGFESEGVGQHRLMGSGNYQKGGRTPAPINLHLKDYSGWANITELAPTQSQDSALPSTGNRGYRIGRSGAATEYFLVENRGAGDKWADSCPDRGGSIWHIDENVTRDDSEQMTLSQHYEVALEQADGQFDLEYDRNRGDSTDLFDSTTGLFNNGTTPNSQWWGALPSGVSIAVLSPPGPFMNVHFDIANTPPIYIYLSEETNNASAGGAYGRFTVNANTAWSWSVDANWVVSREPALQSGNQPFEYDVMSNTSASSRTAVITFTSGGWTATYTITQAGATSNSFPNTLIQTLADGQSFWHSAGPNLDIATLLDAHQGALGSEFESVGQLAVETPGDLGAATSTHVWGNRAVAPQSGTFAASFATTPSGNAVDTTIGFSSGAADAYSDLATCVRFNNQGTVDARNGSGFAAVTNLSYKTGVSYLVEMEINVATKRYRVTVTPVGGFPALIADNFAFRSEQSSVTQLTNLAYLTATGGTQSVGGLAMPALGTVTATNVWGNHAVPPQSGSFTASFTTTPNGSAVDTVIGFSSGPADFWDDLAAYVRFNTAGQVDARNGDVFSVFNAWDPLNYTAGVTYRVDMEINVAEKWYSASVTPAGGGRPVVIAFHYSFRTEQHAVAQLANFAYLTGSVGGTQTVSGLAVSGGLIVIPPLTTPNTDGPFTTTATATDIRLTKEIRLVAGYHATDEIINVHNLSGQTRQVNLQLTDRYFMHGFFFEPDNSWFYCYSENCTGVQVTWLFSGNLTRPTVTLTQDSGSGQLRFAVVASLAGGESATLVIRRELEGYLPLVSGNADLAVLGLSAGTLAPAFDAATTTYGTNVGYATTSMTVTPTTRQGGSTVTVNGVSVASGTASSPISLGVGSNPVALVVTALDGTTTKTYTLNVTRDPITSLQAWRLTWFGTFDNTGNAADDCDFDQDGLVNLLEYAFDLNPKAGSSCQIPQCHWAGGNYVMSLATPTGVSGITYGADWSATLAPNDWHALPDTGTGGQHVFSMPASGLPRIFMRWSVTGNP